jgi:DNA polymerase III subunit epsilon
MTWHTGPMVAFDLESTGVDVESDRIVTACVTLVDGSGKRPIVPMSWLVDPGVDIPQGATDVHGITTEHARQYGRPGAECVEEITDRLHTVIANVDGPIVAFNGCFDLTLLDRECRRHGAPTLSDRCENDGLPLHVVDGFVLDKHVDKFRRGKRTLEAVCQHYGVRLDGAHDASEDAVAAARVAWRIAQQYPQIAEMALVDLHALQVQAKRDQDADFANYLRGQARRARDVEEQLALNARADSITGHWPITPYAGKAVTA